MSYRSILAPIASERHLKTLLPVAKFLAEKHDAHVTGLHVISEVPLYGSMAVEFPQEVIDNQMRSLRENAKALGDSFVKATQGWPHPGEWRFEETRRNEAGNVITEQARANDLVVVCQGPSDDYDAWEDLAPRVVLGSGRPVLVVPSVGSYPSFGKTCVLAWNGSREASRAAFDGLAMLKRAERVHVLAVNPQDEAMGSAQTAGDAIALTLARHGCKVEVHREMNTRIPIAEALLSRTADLGGDLLVMGCYGHSRLRETIFGGATREILKSMTVPVLMSH